MDGSVPDGIVGDVTRLRQILVNLITNAVKFTARGEVVISVTADAPQGSESEQALEPRAPAPVTLHFSVRDTGLGIPPERMDRLFQSFSQLDASTTRQYGGTGLGLAISKRLAELMGGTMWVESDGVPGRGSTFHFTLTGKPAPIPARAPRAQPGPELSGRRVLVVDDNPTNREILGATLEAWGVQVRQAAAPGEALAILRQANSLELILLDGHLPEMDGLALASAIRRLPPPASNLPLVLLTSAGRPDLEPEDIRLAGVLTKPAKPSLLYDLLITIFGAGLPRAAPGAQTLAAEASPPLPGWPLRILLAEDVVVNQKFALAALEQLGYRADVAADGLEALAAVRRQPYDVVFMDVHMPQMDGLEATRQIRQLTAGLEGQGRPYIIAMTANALEGDRELCLAAGMDDYISKPVYLNELSLALGRAAAQIQGQPVSGSQAGRPVSAPAPNDTLDAAVIAEMAGRPGAIELVELYFEEAEEFLKAIATAIAAGDGPAVEEAAHSLKGISGQVGAARVAALAQSIERSARGGAASVELQALTGPLEAAFEQARPALLAALRGS